MSFQFHPFGKKSSQSIAYGSYPLRGDQYCCKGCVFLSLRVSLSEAAWDAGQARLVGMGNEVVILGEQKGGSEHGLLDGRRDNDKNPVCVCPFHTNIHYSAPFYFKQYILPWRSSYVNFFILFIQLHSISLYRRAIMHTVLMAILGVTSLLLMQIILHLLTLYICTQIYP